MGVFWWLATAGKYRGTLMLGTYFDMIIFLLSEFDLGVLQSCGLKKKNSIKKRGGGMETNTWRLRKQVAWYY